MDENLIPNIPHTVTDAKSGVVFRLMAYRRFTDDEATRIIQKWIATQGWPKKAKKGDVFTILYTGETA